MTARGKRYRLSVLLFLLLFGGMLAIATFCDLKVSRILTRFSLSAGDYYTNNVFANFFEAAGMFPGYALRAFAALSIGWFFCKTFPQKSLRALSLLLGAAVAVHLLSGGFRDFIFYPMRHAIGVNADAAITAIKNVTPAVYLLSYALSALSVGAAVVATKNVDVDVWRKLTYFAICVFAISFLADGVVSFLKGYVDRVRFRSMNSAYGASVGGFDLYTRWYEVTDHADILRATPLVNYTDAFRSFPSGHTEAAGISYTLILLVDCLSVKKKHARFALWAIPIGWTGLTAIGRIVAGAHFMSDVLIGGSVPFVLVVLFREVFFRKCNGIFEMLPSARC